MAILGGGTGPQGQPSLYWSSEVPDQAAWGMAGQRQQNDFTREGWGFQNSQLQQQLASQERQGNRDAGIRRMQGNQQFTLGLGQNRNTATRNANDFTLGQGGLENQRIANANQFELGQGANRNTATRNANEFSLGQGRLGLDTTAEGHQYALGQGNLALGQGNLDLQREALGSRNRHWSTAFGALQDAMNGVNAWRGGYAGGGPNISDAPVYSEDMIQQKVNAARAQNDAGAANRVQQQQRELAGRGMGAHSPLAMALQNTAMGQALQANTSNERETRLGAAGMNAQQVLEAQKAREGQFANRQEESIKRQQAQFGLRGQLASSLASMI